jgi:hypothetical protein
LGIAGGVWEPSSRRWLIERRRIGRVILKLRAVIDPLFRRAGSPEPSTVLVVPALLSASLPPALTRQVSAVKCAVP